MTCKKCGSEIDVNETVCKNCGAKVKAADDKKNISTIVTIVIFLIMFAVGFVIGRTQFKEKTPKEKEALTNEQKEEEKKEETTEETSTFDLFDVTKISKEKADTTDTTKNIEISNLFFNPKSQDYGKTRYVYIHGKNNNSSAVNVKVSFEFYDSEGYKIKTSSTFDELVSANKEFVFYISIPDDSLDYKTVKLVYVAKKLKTYETEIPLDKLEYTATKLQDETIEVMVKNNTDTKIDMINFACIYYKDGKEVFAQSTSVTSLDAKQSNKATFYKNILRLNTDYSNPKAIEYDDYKVVLYGAKNTDSENY